MLIQNNFDRYIQLHFFGPKLEKRFQQKSNMSLEMMETIHRTAIDRAYKKVPLQNKIAIFNSVHQKWSTNMTVAKWDCEKKSHMLML